jgi:hypothetical protein
MLELWKGFFKECFKGTNLACMFLVNIEEVSIEIVCEGLEKINIE